MMFISGKTDGFLIVCAVLLFVAPVLNTLFSGEELTTESRAELPGQFVELSDGFTRYAWTGPEDGQKVVLIHGLSSPYFTWDRNFDALGEAGLRVLRYDHFGSGFSDRPRTRYDTDLFDRQLFELLESQGVGEPVDLVGHSMGGAIATIFADRHPERVRKLVLFAPAGANELPAIARLLRVPGLGDWLVGAFGPIAALYVIPRTIAPPGAEYIFRQEYREQYRYRGYLRALLSTVRYGPLHDLDDVMARVGAQDRQGLLFWGTRDNVLPYPLHERVLEQIPFLAFVPVRGAGHFIPYEAADEVNPVVINFLRP